jgi:hypothetical protein
VICLDQDGKVLTQHLTESEDAAVVKLMERWQAIGWEEALTLYGLGAFEGAACTVRNDGRCSMRVPLGRREAVLDLEPGESATIRHVEDRWWE